MKKFIAATAFLALSSCAFADAVAWVTDGSANFGKLDLNTGSYSQTSNFGFVGAGLGEIGNTLYTADEGGMTLYSINTADGSTHAIGNNSSISYFAFGSTNTGLYMVDTVGGLWTIDPKTGAASLVGSTFINVGSNSLAVSTGSNVLYVASGSDLFTINTSTGQGTLIGSTTNTDFGALTNVHGTVFGTSIINGNQSYSLDPATSIATLLANLSTPNYAYGVAPIVPEPASFALVGLAAGIFAAYAWKRKRTA